MVAGRIRLNRTRNRPKNRTEKKFEKGQMASPRAQPPSYPSAARIADSPCYPQYTASLKWVTRYIVVRVLRWPIQGIGRKGNLGWTIGSLLLSSLKMPCGWRGLAEYGLPSQGHDLVVWEITLLRKVQDWEVVELVALMERTERVYAMQDIGTGEDSSRRSLASSQTFQASPIMWSRGGTYLSFPWKAIWCTHAPFASLGGWRVSCSFAYPLPRGLGALDLFSMFPSSVMELLHYREGRRWGKRSRNIWGMLALCLMELI
ncbi:Cox19 family protein [Actinidia rufa]|uniref:Cox19 family protein n=1 Tax=Actinidia rufa TaxID=165716 RepID=A0A7J0FY93_9ERIC|nr:Cox19 family protein [Actinidia rufa]